MKKVQALKDFTYMHERVYRLTRLKLEDAEAEKLVKEGKVQILLLPENRDTK